MFLIPKTDLQNSVLDAATQPHTHAAAAVRQRPPADAVSGGQHRVLVDTPRAVQLRE